MPDTRERALCDGIEGLSDAELLTLLLGSGTREQSVALFATALLETEGGLRALSRSTPQALALRRGVGPGKATRLAAAFELGRRGELVRLSLTLRLESYEQVVQWAQPRLANLEHEEVWLLVLDGRNALKSSRRIAQGGQHACALTTRDVLAPALRDGGSSIVLVHNHPSGDPRPSAEDVSMTRALAAACDVVGIPLFDHVVVAREGACSLFNP